MSTQSGTVVGAPIVTGSDSNKFGTHFSYLGVGGHIEVWDVAARDAIPVDDFLYFDGFSSGRRRLGMEVVTMVDGAKYLLLVPNWHSLNSEQKLAALADNDNWYASGPTAPVTYDYLRSLKEANQLVIGQYYLITDFRTRHVIPNTNEINEGGIEPITVLAVNNHQFSGEASSTLYPLDKIHYDFDDNLCEDGTTPRTGKITFRSDTKRDITTFYDWRVVKYRRWRITGDRYLPTSSYAKGAVVESEGNLYVSLVASNLNNPVTDVTKWGSLWKVGMNPYLAPRPTPIRMGFALTVPVVPEDYRDYYTFNANVDSVNYDPVDDSSGGKMTKIYLGHDTEYNEVVIMVNDDGSNVRANNLKGLTRTTFVIKTSMYNNEFGTGSYENIVHVDTFNQNIINSWFMYNAIMGTGFFDNVMGSDFKFHIVGTSGLMASCTIDNYFANSFFGSNASRLNGCGDSGQMVVTGANCRRNTFARNCAYITINGANFENNTLTVPLSTNNTFTGNNIQYNTFNARVTGSAFNATFANNVFNSPFSSKTLNTGFSNKVVHVAQSGKLFHIRVDDDGGIAGEPLE